MSASTVLDRNLHAFAVVMSALVAFIYFLIGFKVVSVLDTTGDQIFGIFAGIGYAVGVFLLLVYDRRLVWILGVLLQIFVIYTYFNLAADRSPAFEFWGILLRVLQLLLLLALTLLVYRSSRSAAVSTDGQ